MCYSQVIYYILISKSKLNWLENQIFRRPHGSVTLTNMGQAKFAAYNIPIYIVDNIDQTNTSLVNHGNELFFNQVRNIRNLQFSEFLGIPEEKLVKWKNNFKLENKVKIKKQPSKQNHTYLSLINKHDDFWWLRKINFKYVQISSVLLLEVKGHFRVDIFFLNSSTV